MMNVQRKFSMNDKEIEELTKLWETQVSLNNEIKDTLKVIMGALKDYEIRIRKLEESKWGENK